MIKNSVIIIPNISESDQVCDFVLQTKKILNQQSHVYLINCFESQSAWQLIIDLLKGKLIDWQKPIDILPLKRFSLIKKLNKQLYFIFLQLFLLFKHWRIKNHYLWMFFPQLAWLLESKLPSWQVIFDIVDYHDNPDQNIKKSLNKNKKLLLQKANYIFTISHTLKNFYQANVNLDIEVVPQGFDLNSFLKQRQTTLKLPKGKKILGFIGQISERLDFVLLDTLIKQNPQINFVFVGPWHHESNLPIDINLKSKFERLFQEENCFYYGKQARETLLSILNHFDLCMIPYNTSFEFNRYSYPMKLLEYFYVGKPVISTNIPELARFPDFVKMSEDPEIWQKNIQKILQKPWPKKNQLQQKQIALNNSWEKKIESIYGFIRQK